MFKKPFALLSSILFLTMLACSLPFHLGDQTNTTPSQTVEAVQIPENTPQPTQVSGIIPNDDPLLGKWTAYQVRTYFTAPVQYDEAQTWLGNLVEVGTDSIQFNQEICLLTAFERTTLPENYQEYFQIDLSTYGIPEESVSWISTSCEGSAFSRLIQVDAYTILLNWQGNLLWLQHSDRVPQRPIVYANTHYLREDMIRNVNIHIPQINIEQPASQAFNDTAFTLYNDVLTGFITDTSEWEMLDDIEMPASDMEITFDVLWNDGERLSILGIIYFYFSGAAHPNMGYLPLTYDLTTQTQITIRDLFQAGSGFENFLLDTCSTELIRRDIGYFEESLSNDLMHYENFALTPSGIMIYFAPYHVASYAAGPQNILIPYASLTPYLKAEYLPPMVP